MLKGHCRKKRLFFSSFLVETDFGSVGLRTLSRAASVVGPRSGPSMTLQPQSGNSCFIALLKPELPHSLRASFPCLHPDFFFKSLVADYLFLPVCCRVACCLSSNPRLVLAFSTFSWAEPYLLQQGLNFFQVCCFLGTLPQP